MHGDWITATATVLAAIIGVLGGYLLAKYQREKRILRFVVMGTEDLAASLRAHGNFEIKFAHFSTTELILSTISVVNTGNCSIMDVAFTLKLPGEHPFAQINCASENMALAEQVTVLPPAKSGIDPSFPVSLPYFNANERFRINVLYTGQPSQCEIICRLPDATVQVYSVSDLNRINERRNVWKTILTAIAAGGAGLAFASGSALINAMYKPI